MDKTEYDTLLNEYFNGAIAIMKDQIKNSLIQSFTEKIIKEYKTDPQRFEQKFKVKFKVKYITDIDVGSHVLEVIQDDIAKSQEESKIAQVINNRIKSNIDKGLIPNKSDIEIKKMIRNIFDTLECFIIEYYDINYIAESKPRLLKVFESIHSKLAEKIEFTEQVDTMLHGINQYLIEYEMNLDEKVISKIKTLIEESIPKKIYERDINDELKQGLLEEFEKYEKNIDELTVKARTLRKTKLITQLQQTFSDEITSLKQNENLIYDLRAGYMISNILCGVLGYRFFNTQTNPEIITKKKLRPFTGDNETKKKFDDFLTVISSKPDPKEYLQSLLFEKSKDYFMLEKIKPEHYYKHSKKECYLGNFLSNTASEQTPEINNIYKMLHKLKGTQEQPSIEDKELNYLKLYGCNATASQGKNFSTMKIGSINNSSFINTNLKSDKFNKISFNNTSFNSYETTFITKFQEDILNFNNNNNIKLDMGDIFGLYAYPKTSRNHKTIIENANFEGCKINNCTFKDINFTNCSVNSGTKFNNCSFSKCNIDFIIKEPLELTECTFIDCKISNYDHTYDNIYKFERCKFFGPKTRENINQLYCKRMESGYYYRNFNTHLSTQDRFIINNEFYYTKLHLAAIDYFEFKDCKFHNMYFEHVRFTENTKFNNCTFIDSHFSRSVIVTRKHHTTFTNKCKFFNCDLTRCLISYPAYNPLINSLIEEGTIFNNCNLQFFANQTISDRYNQYLNNINLNNPNNSNIDSYKTFENAKLKNINFTKSNMSCNEYVGTQFYNCTLDNTDFALRADRFGRSIFTFFSNKTRFINTSLKGANLFCVQGFGNHQEQLLNTELKPTAQFINDNGLIEYKYVEDTLEIKSQYIKENVLNFVTEKGVSDKLTGVNFRAVDLTGAIFGLDEANHCNLKACSFLEADLNFATFTGIEADEIENCDFTRLLGYPRRDNHFVIEEETIDAIQNNNAATEVHARTKFYMGNIDLKSVILSDDSPEDSKNIVSIMFKNIPYSIVKSGGIEIFPEMNKSNIEHKIIEATNSIEKKGCIPFIPTSELNGRLQISENLIQLFVNYLGSANDEPKQIQFLKDLHEIYFVPLIELAKNVDKSDNLTKMFIKYKDVFVKPDSGTDHFAVRSLVVSTLQKKIDGSDKPDDSNWNYYWYQVVIVPMIFLVYQPIKYIKIWLEGFILGITSAYAIQGDNKYGMSCAPGILGRLISEHTGTMGVVNDLIELNIKSFNVNEKTFMLKVIDKINKKLPDDVIELIRGELFRTELNLDEKYEEKIQHYVETLRYDYFQIMMKLEPNTSYPTNLIIEDLIKGLPYIETDLSLFIRTEWSELLAEEHEKDENKFNTLASIINHFKQSAHKIKYTHNGKTYNEIYQTFINEAVAAVAKGKSESESESESLRKIAELIVAREKLRINIALRAAKKSIKLSIWGFYGKDPSEQLILDKKDKLVDPFVGGKSNTPQQSDQSDKYEEPIEDSSSDFDSNVDNQYCIRQFLLFIKNSVKNIKKINPQFFTNIKDNDRILSKIDIEMPQPVKPRQSGSEWYSIGMEKPKDGKKYNNPKLKSALEKSEFTYVNFEDHKYENIDLYSYVEVNTRYGVEYFIPVERSKELVFHYYMGLHKLFESLTGSCNNLIYILDKDEPPIFDKTLEESFSDIYNDLIHENDELKDKLKILKETLKETLSKELEKLPESIESKIQEHKKLPEQIKQHIEIESDIKMIEMIKILKKSDKEIETELTELKKLEKPSDKQERKELIKYLKRLTELKNLKLINGDKITNPNILHYLLYPFITTQFTDNTKYKPVVKKMSEDEKMKLPLLNRIRRFRNAMRTTAANTAKIARNARNAMRRTRRNIKSRTNGISRLNRRSRKSVRNAIDRTTRAANIVRDSINRRTTRAAATVRNNINITSRRSRDSSNLPILVRQNTHTHDTDNKLIPRESTGSANSSSSGEFEAGNKITLNMKKGGKKMKRSILNSKKTIKKFKKY